MKILCTRLQLGLRNIIQPYLCMDPGILRKLCLVQCARCFRNTNSISYIEYGVQVFFPFLYLGEREHMRRTKQCYGM